MNPRAQISLSLILLLASPGAAPAAPQDPAPAAAGGMTIEDLRVVVSKSLVIDYPADISRISTSNPEVVDAVPATSREFLLHGKGHGSATVVVWAKTGQRTMYNVTVEHNLDPIKRLLKDAFPNENVAVQAGRDSIALTGVVSSKEIGERMSAAVAPLAKSVVNNLAVSAAPVSKQIVLKVKFAELNRNASTQFGVNLVSTGFMNTPSRITTGQFAPPSTDRVSGAIPGGNTGTTSSFNITDALNVFAFRPDLNLSAFVRALQGQGLLQILAEPNLVTTDNQEASFLVGGEFPVPILQGGANAGAVTIQFREFGIRLSFKPQLTANGTVKLYVKPEVSTIDLANATTLSGFTIPALATKRIETNIELGEGQSFVIAGLIDDRVTDTVSKIPGLASIPLLGTIFRSRSLNRSKSELVVIVTPELTQPLNPGDPKPEPVWVKEFLPSLKQGDKTDLEIVPGMGRVPSREDATHRDASGKPISSTKPVAPPPDPADPDKKPWFKFWGGKKADPATPVAAAKPAATAAMPDPAPPPTPLPTLVTPPDPNPATPAAPGPVAPAPVAPAPVQSTPVQATPVQIDPLPFDLPIPALPALAPLALPAAPPQAAPPQAAPPQAAPAPQAGPVTPGKARPAAASAGLTSLPETLTGGGQR